MLAPQAYIAWINLHLGFNPRSQAASNALSDFVLADLKEHCSLIREHLAAKVVEAKKNAAVRTRTASRNVDLVLAEAACENAVAVRLAVEHKTIMAAHGKARLNRYGDIIAYCNHLHNHRTDAIAATTVIVNSSGAYQNPDAFARTLVRPKFDMQKVMADTVKIFANILPREKAGEPNDLPEAVAVVVIDYDGLHPAKLIEQDPPPGGAINYGTFLGRLCEIYTRRFGSADDNRRGRIK